MKRYTDGVPDDQGDYVRYEDVLALYVPYERFEKTQATGQKFHLEASLLRGQVTELRHLLQGILQGEVTYDRAQRYLDMQQPTVEDFADRSLPVRILP